MKRVLLVCVALLGLTARADEPAWCGNPEVVLSPENPYLALAERNVTQALAASEPETYWLVWGAVAPESRRRGDAALRERALAATEKLAAAVRAEPHGHWGITMLLECVLRWKKSGEVPAPTLAGWLEAGRPSVEKSFAENTKGIAGDADAEWVTFAPNALLQSAAVLALADRLYGEPRYGEMARQLVRRTAAHQLPGGAFSYIRDSGPSPLYYGFESTFLARYYQLTRDPEAKRMLVAMAGYARDAQANGLIQGSSTPWWKHHWGTGGAIHGIEAVAGLSRDPLARALAEKRLAGGQRYYFSHVSMYFWDGGIPLGDLGADLCAVNANIHGPQLRRNGWEVVMPLVAFGDTVVGASVCGDKTLAFENYLQSAGLPILLKDTVDYRGRDESLFMIAPEDAGRGGACVGEGWIAAGRVFRPRRGSYGEAVAPAAEGWALTQVWFADAHGVAGWLRASRTGQAVANQKPAGVLDLGKPVTEVPGQADRLQSGSLALAFFGDQVKAVRGRGKSAWVELAGSADRDVFEYGASVVHDATGAATEVSALRRDASGALVARVRIEGTKPAWLLFNATDTAKSLPAPAAGRLSGARKAAGATSSEVKRGEAIPLGAWELAVLFSL